MSSEKSPDHDKTSARTGKTTGQANKTQSESSKISTNPSQHLAEQQLSSETHNNASTTTNGGRQKSVSSAGTPVAAGTQQTDLHSTKPNANSHKSSSADPSGRHGSVASLGTALNAIPDDANSAGNGTSTVSGKQEVKILLLGSGESGKSTILKQMKIINQNGYSQEELLMYKTTVYKNLIDCAKAVVAALKRFDMHITNDNGDAQTLASVDLDLISSATISPDPDSVLDHRLTRVVRLLWDSPEVRTMFNERRSEFYIMDSAPYFFDNVERIGDLDYIPNVNDILRARIKTTGVYESRFEMGGLNIHMYDVGGQRSERKKWIHCFDNVTLIIFCVALSEYDQVLLEENNQNRMAESLVLFESVINSQWFARTSVVLFLNKIDVFTEKLPYSPLENYFPDYTGGGDINKAAKYILWRFNQANRTGLNIYPHLTQATDTSNIRLVFAAVKETILQNSLRDSGIL